MNFKSRIVLSILVIFMALNMSLQAQKVSGYDLNAKIPSKPELKTGELSNGLKYYILKNKKPENRTDLQIVVRAGSVHEDDDQAGLAHFLEHMAFNGTKNFPKMELVSFLESTGMRFGADVNANTGFDRTYYMITIPMDKPGMLDKGFTVLEDWLRNISFDAEEIEKERGVIMEEWRLYEANANGRVQNKHFKKFLEGSKFANRSPIGDTNIIQKAPREAFTRFYNDFYRPNLSAIIAVGDFDVAEIEKKIVDIFGDVKNPDKIRPREEFEIPINPKPIISIEADPELVMPNYTLIFKRKSQNYPSGTYGEYRNNIIVNLFSTVFQYRLQEISRKSDSPFQFAMGGYGKFLVQNLDAFQLITVPKLNTMNEAYSKLLEEAFRLTRHGVTKSELERAKTEILRGLEKALSEKDKTESGDLARELYRHFHEGESVPGIEAEYKIQQDFMKDISVEEVNKFLKPLLADEGLVIAGSFPKKPEIKIPTESELLAKYQAVKAMNIEPYKDVDVDKPLMSKKPTPGKISNKKNWDKLDTKELTLSNGAKVFLKKTDFKNDQVLFRGFSIGGTSLASDEDYHSAALASSIINESGLGEFDQTSLEKLLQGKIVRVSPYISSISEGFSGSASPKDLETMFQMIYLYFNSPRKDLDAFKTEMSNLKEQIINSGSNPDRVFSDSINAVMGNYHFRAMPWTLESIEKVNLDKAFKFYQSRFTDASDFTFTFVGNYDEKEMETMIETYLASIKSDNSKNNYKDVGIKSPKKGFTKEVKKGIEPKSTVRLVINGDAEYNKENRFALRSLVEVMNIRLREVIREDKGGVYGIGARPRLEKYPNPEYSISIFFGTSPAKVKDLITAAKGVIDELKSGTFKDDNIDKVKEIMKREYEVNLKENNFWLNSIYNSLYNGDDLNEILENNQLVDKITKDYVVSAAKKYLNMDSFKEFILYPED